MERFQDGWKFLTLSPKVALEEVSNMTNEFQDIELPHDWLIYHTDKLAGNVAETGWYRKAFYIDSRRDFEQWILRFDGIYMDSTIYLNRHKVHEWKNGYISFEVDITPFLVEGENVIMISVVYETPNSRWYSGAGIYRSVWLKKQLPTHLISDGLYITTTKAEQGWYVSVDAEVIAKSPVTLRHSIRKRESKAWSGIDSSEHILPSDTMQIISSTMYFGDPMLWEPDSPVLYEIVTELLDGKTIIDRQYSRFGFRYASFDPDKGFFLNGKHVKFQGVCEHHDLGGLGSAFYVSAMKRKFDILKAMGVNAIRTAHNMPAREVIELADEMGILVVSEFSDMWEHPKNEKDYARFFPEWYQKDVAAWVRRDRNSPSVVMWSIGNEIYDTHADAHGQEMTLKLKHEVLKHDPKEHARVTLCSNYMPWENAQKCADIVKIAGYNYAEHYYREHHKRYPDWVIYGSETASVVQSRGIYHFPASEQILTDSDRQCSSLGNSITSWGAKSIESCIIAEEEHPFSCGQFIWSGFDYIGEPTPYHTKNSYFGQVDTAGFPKDSYYRYQASWTDYKQAPMVHLYPYWDFNVGQLIDVGVYSNAPQVELFINGASLGKKQIDHSNPYKLSPRWQLPYQEGELCAVAYDEAGKEICRNIRRSFGDACKILLTPDKSVIHADGTDLVFVTVEMADAKGNLVENANNRVEVSVDGAGRLIALDNGDSTDYDEYKGTSRRLFSGKLLAVIAAKSEEGAVQIKATSKGMEAAKCLIRVCRIEDRQSRHDAGRNRTYTENRDRTIKTGNGNRDEIPVRKIEILCRDKPVLTGDKKEISLEALLHPGNASYRKVIWEVTDNRGIPSNLAKIESVGTRAVLKAIGNGNCRVRCMTKNGGDQVSLISQLEFHMNGFEHINLDPYEFVYGGVYSTSKGTVGNGNEHGFATARDEETQVGFENLDFGHYGSDEITIPIFSLSGEAYYIQIWEGVPGGTKNELIADVVYQKPCVWNVYQEVCYQLNKKLTGITSIFFVLHQKIHVKGFVFTKQRKGLLQLNAGDADHIYGDHFVKEGASVREIGNNVSLEFHKMDFGSVGIRKITICGNSTIWKNSIHIFFRGAQGEQKQLIEFLHTNTPEAVEFTLNPVSGMQDVTFLFLPGSRFDFDWFRFE